MEIKNLLPLSEFEVRADRFIQAAEEIAARMTSEGLRVRLHAEKPSQFFIDKAAMVAKRIEKKDPNEARGILQMADELDKETAKLCK